MKIEKPYISVIIPTYNRADYIVDAIDSVINQKDSIWSYEIIVVDDGSTDNTKQLLNRYGEKISYHRIKRSGLPARARNFGIAKAAGELIAFQDSDDLWIPDKFSLQVPAFDDKQTILSYGNAKIMSSLGKLSDKTIIPPGSGKTGRVFEDLLDVNFISTLTVMVRKDELTKSGGFNESPSLRAVEDYELWLRLATKGRFVYIDESLAIHRRHDKNISHSIEYEGNQHILSVYRSLLKQHLTKHETKSVRMAIVRILKEQSPRLIGKSLWANKSKILYHKTRTKLY
jgi:glycosyltransferase involved in cell wall biosynthesis